MGLGRTDHAPPLHDTTKVWFRSDTETAIPTASQVVGLVQDTPMRPPPPVVVGPVMTVQVLPFQDSTSERDGLDGSPVVPTAMHRVGLAHETP